MLSVWLSTATKLPNRLVTARNSMKGRAAGSFQGWNFRRTAPRTFFAKAATPRSRLLAKRSLLARRHLSPDTGHLALHARIVRCRGVELCEGLRRRIDRRILEHRLVELLLRRLVAVSVGDVVGVARRDVRPQHEIDELV